MPTVAATLQIISLATNSHVRSIVKFGRSFNALDEEINGLKESIKGFNAILQTLNQSGPSDTDESEAAPKKSAPKKEALGLGESLNPFISVFTKAFDAFGGTQSIDAFTNANYRLDMVNDGSQSTEEMRNILFGAAQRSQSNFMDMAQMVSDLKLAAPDMFGNNEELIGFMELAQKSFRIAGSPQEDQSSGMEQFLQAMESGSMNGSQFDEVMKTAPMIAEAVSSYTGLSISDLQRMAEEGALTADIIKFSMFSAADEINESMAAVPYTFSSLFTGIENQALQSFAPVMLALSALMGDVGPDIVSILGAVFDKVAAGALILLEIISAIYEFFSSNWSTLGPIIEAIAIALIAVSTALRLVAIGQAIVNTVMKLNPYLLIAVLIIGLITWLIRLWQVNDDFAAALMGIWNSILGFFDQVPIFFQRVGNGIVNVFQWIKVKVYELLDRLINHVIDKYNELVGWLNMVPGVELEMLSHVDFSTNAAEEAEAIKRAGESKILEMQQEAERKMREREKNTQKMLEDRANKREEQEQDIDFSKFGVDAYSLPVAIEPAGMLPTSPALPDIGRVDEVGKVKKIDSEVDIASEDLKIMRDLAEMKAIQNFVTLTPVIDITTGPIMQEGNVDDMLARMNERLRVELEASARGVYDAG